MSTKLEEMRRTSGGSIAESMGGGRIIPGEFRPGPSAIPARLVGVKRRGDVSDIPVGMIGPDPDQPRKHFDSEAIEKLAGSLATRGQLQPIRVRWNEARGQYVVMIGERRYQAAMKAGLSTLACVIVEGEIEPAELLSIQLIENCLREDLRPIEQAKAFRAIMEARGWTQADLAGELRITQSAVAKSLATLDLPEAVQAKVEDGTLDPSKAYVIAKLEDPAEQVELAERIVSEGLSRDEAVEVVREAKVRKPSKTAEKGRGPKVAKLPTERTIKVDRFKVTVSSRKGFDVETWLEVMQAALDQIREQVESN